MKKIILIIISVICIIGNSSAQESKNSFRDKIQFGLKAGFNYSNVYDEQGEQFEGMQNLV